MYRLSKVIKNRKSSKALAGINIEVKLSARLSVRRNTQPSREIKNNVSRDEVKKEVKNEIKNEVKNEVVLRKNSCKKDSIMSKDLERYLRKLKTSLKKKSHRL